MPISSILWGVSSSGSTPHYENELLIGYPAYDWVTDRVPREGSEFAQAPSGVEDAWITGRDYVFDAEIRFIPDKPSTSPDRGVVAGPNSWQAFLDYCRDKNDFRFVPNVNTPDFYVDKCYLVEPLRGFGGNLADLTRGVRLVMRTTSMDFTQAMRGVAFEYKSGEQIQNLSTGASFSRTGAVTFVQSPSTSKAGQTVASAGTGVVRDRHRSSSSERMTLLEVQSTNEISHSEDFSQAAWSKTGLSVTVNDRAAPDATGSTTADRLVASTSSGLHFAASSYQPITTGEFLSALAHFRGAELQRVELLLQDTGADEIGAAINFASSAVSGFTAGTATLGSGHPVLRPLVDSWYEARLSGRFGSSSTSARLVVAFVSTSGGSTSRTFAGATSGAGLHAWGAQLERLDAPTGYVATSSAAGGHNTDVLSVNWPWKPQAGWFYIKAQHLGSTQTATANYLAIDSTGGGVPGLLVRKSTALALECRFDITSTETLTAQSSGYPSYGDILELLAVVSTDRAVTIRRSVNGGTESGSTTAASVAPFPSTWNAATLWLGSLTGSTAIQPSLGVIHVKAGFSTGVTTIASARSA